MIQMTSASEKSPMWKLWRLSTVLEGMRHSLGIKRLCSICADHRYQSSGYYVSLFAAARKHRPMPSVSTLQDMKLPTLVRHVSDDLDELIRKSLWQMVAGHLFRVERILGGTWPGNMIAEPPYSICLSRLF